MFDRYVYSFGMGYEAGTRVWERNQVAVDRLCLAVTDGHTKIRDAARTHPPLVVLLAYMRISGLNQAKLAPMLRMSQPNVSRLLSGVIVPDDAQRAALQRLCSIPADHWDRSWKAA